MVDVQKILIVDDRPENVLALEQVLRDSGGTQDMLYTEDQDVGNTTATQIGGLLSSR
jgi:CheY-like chemotaxis protein